MAFHSAYVAYAGIDDRAAVSGLLRSVRVLYVEAAGAEALALCDAGSSSDDDAFRAADYRENLQGQYSADDS